MASARTKKARVDLEFFVVGVYSRNNKILSTVFRLIKLIFRVLRKHNQDPILTKFSASQKDV